jgi:predicted Ser/Thr protein kinase
VEITTLPVVRRIKANVFNAKYGTVVAVAKVARFEFEIPFIEAETRVYRVIDGHTVGPKFFGHLLENGRPMGMQLEFLDGRRPIKDDFDACSRSLCRLHSLGWAHGDINRDNFVILGSEAKLIDFEASGPATNQETDTEFDKLYEELIDESGRGAPAYSEDFADGEYPIGI